MHFVGIDLHKKQSQLCILDAQGEVVLETRIPTSRPDLTDVLGDYTGSRVVLEASTPSEWVARHLETIGMEVIVADPNFAPMYATRSKKIKTDKRDARCLAQAARLGAYKPAHRMSDEQREVRTRIEVRRTLVQMRTCMINQIRAVLLGQGYQVGSGAAEHFAKRLSRVELPPSLQAQIEPLLTLLHPLNEQIGQVEQKLQERAETSEDARLCMTLPGIGPLTSLMFLAALDGATRFRSAHQVMSYLGLVPRESSSGESQKRGHITKAGCTQTRALLVQAAQRILRLKNPDTEVLWIWAEGIAKRRGKRIAVVALARRLSGILWAILRDGQVYQAKRRRADGEAKLAKARTSSGTPAQAA